MTGLSYQSRLEIQVGTLNMDVSQKALTHHGASGPPSYPPYFLCKNGPSLNQMYSSPGIERFFSFLLRGLA
jgi:hypothetical protein